MLERIGIAVCFMIAIMNSVALAEDAKSKATKSTGDDKKFIIEALPKTLSRRVEDQRRMLEQVGIHKPDQATKGIINALKIWTPDVPAVKICFYEGSEELRARIAKIALEWKSASTSVPFDFGDPNSPRVCERGEFSHVRVTFRDTGYWSLVGKDSVKLAQQTEPSMNLQDFDTAPPNAEEFRTVVLHEFGHALGLEHEHQNPLSKCYAEFDWPKIYKYLGGPPNNWSKEQVDFQMGHLNEPGLYATAFDKDSIMLYTFPPSYFKAGKQSTCFSEPNRSLSAGDKGLIAALYPSNSSERVALIRKIRDHHLQLIAASGQTQGNKSAVLQMMNEYLPEPK